MDVLLDISARSDPVTLVRCAAASKDLRREIADPAFHPRLRLRRADRFMPRFFRGWFVQNQPKKVIEPPRFSDPVRPAEPSPEPFRSFLLDNDSIFEFYHPELTASRGLVALRSNTPESGGPPGTCVFNPMTGYVNCIPPPKINAQSFVLLTSDDGDGACHYRQVAAELASGRLKTQEFSPVDDNSRWQPIAETAVAPCPQDAALLHPALVLQGDAQWLCRSSEYHFLLRFSRAQLQASVTKIGGICGEQLHGRGREELLLVLVEPESIHQDDVLSERLELRWFGEKSGFVFVRMAGANESSLSWYFMLELATRRVRGVCKGAPQNALVYLPYEMDLSFWRPKFTRQLQ
uniref:F-box domain-containing protein n=1 Tax=Aegilops tauschii TaxID=37682 RepID=M8CY45_AEGTA